MPDNHPEADSLLFRCLCFLFSPKYKGRHNDGDCQDANSNKGFIPGRESGCGNISVNAAILEVGTPDQLAEMLINKVITENACKQLWSVPAGVK